MAETIMDSPEMSKGIVSKIARKIKAEMKNISSKDHDSILRDSEEAVKHFSWETVVMELRQKLPTLMSLLSHLVGTRVPLLCLLASQILKAKHQHLGLVQRAVSVMLYGNGTAKQVKTRQYKSIKNLIMFLLWQVFNNLQPLCVCMSYQRTLDIIKQISSDHDVEVQEWAHELEKKIERPSNTAKVLFPMSHYMI